MADDDLAADVLLGSDDSLGRTAFERDVVLIRSFRLIDMLEKHSFKNGQLHKSCFQNSDVDTG